MSVPCGQPPQQPEHHQEGNPEPLRKPPTHVKTSCGICPRSCRLSEGQLGACKARRCGSGVVQAESYGRITSLALDPIEKKPLARYCPGSHVLSIGSYGCNLHCPWCQNASIADAGADAASWRELSPQEVVEAACDLQDSGSIGIAFTYNEPLIGYEFVYDTARFAHEAGLKNILVSNGQINAEPLDELLPFIDAANIDLKGFTEALYEDIGGSLNATLHCIASMAECDSCHVEVTTLVIPGLNDAEEEIERAAAWLAGLNADIPYHISRFFPAHHMLNASPTPVASVYRLAEVARRYLAYVYTGNC